MIIRNVEATDLTSLSVDTMGQTLRGKVIADKVTGEPLGIAGVLHTEPFYAFSMMTDELREYPKAIVKFMREFSSFLQQHYEAVYAIPAGYEINSRGCLEMIGFRYLYSDMNYGDVYRWSSSLPS